MNSNMFPKVQTVDYWVFAVMIVISGAIGLYNSFKGNKSPEEFLMGNRSFKPLPIAMSLLTSYVSAISLLGFSGEVYAFGSQLGLFIVGTALGILFAAKFILPVIYPLKLTSVNEYIELRFKSKRLRQVVFTLSSIQALLYMGVCLYAPTIALVSVTNLSYLTYIFLLGIICTIYSSFGGIRAIVWTDVFQLSVMLIGLLFINIVGYFQIGGMIKILNIASNGGRLDFFNMDPSPYVRHTFINVISFGFFFYAYLYSAAQINIQRMCSVKTIEEARRVLNLNIYGMVIIYLLIFCSGLVAYAAYADCDPMALGFIKKKEEILPYFITDKLSFIPGLAGMFIATLIGGTMSYLSSVISSVVAMVWKDFCVKIPFFKNCSAGFATLANKTISMLVGFLIIGIALLSSQTKGLLQLAFVITSTFASPIFGVFLIGFFLPKCNIKGVWAGLTVSLIITGWMSFGAHFFSKRNDPMLNFVTSGCHNDAVSVNSSLNISNISILNNEDVNKTVPIDYENHMWFLYGISYTLYSAIAPLSCIFVAIFVSCLTGNQKVEETSPAYVTPCMRSFYWSKEELQNFYQKKDDKMAHNGDSSTHLKDSNPDFELILNIPLEIINK